MVKDKSDYNHPRATALILWQ